MRHLHKGGSLLAAAGMLGFVTFAQAAPTKDQTSSAANQQQSQREASGNSPENRSDQSKPAPAGFVLLDEQLITMTANEPQSHFMRAADYLAQNHPRAAAAEVRIGAAYLDMQAARSGEAQQKELKSVAAHLRKVADHLTSERNEHNSKNPSDQQEANAAKNQSQQGNTAKGETHEEKMLSHSFARAERVLAQHFQAEAKREIGSNKPTMAGEDLGAGASALTASFAWTGEQCPENCTKVIADARRLSDQLLNPGERTQAMNETGRAGEAQGKSDHANGQAETAAAHLKGENHENASQSGRIPADAQQVVDEFGKAVTSESNANSSNRSEKAEQNQNGQKPADAEKK